jgi:DNA-binding CsgD family transcriptional regulator
MNTKDALVLIDSFYMAALEPDRWPGTVAQMASFFGSESAAINVRTEDFSIAWRVTTANYDHAAQREYADYFHRLDPFANAWRVIGKPGVFVGHELVDPETFRQSEIYNGYCRRIGVFHSLGGVSDLSSTSKLLLGIHRPIERADFTAEDKHRLELLLPHLSRAAQMQMVMATAEAQRHLTHRLSAALPVAVIAVDKGREVAFANGLADQLLLAGDGLKLQKGRLMARDPRQDAALQQAICRATLVASGAVAQPSDVLLVQRADRQPLSVLVVPLPRNAWDSGSTMDASAIIFASDPEWPPPLGVAALAARYDLTPAEGRLFEALLQGERIADYSDRVGVSTNTANTLLKRIFAKTDTNRQADLIRLVLSDPIAALAGRPSTYHPRHCQRAA